MKPTFHVFPAGLTGLALLLLRVSVALPLGSLPSANAPFFTPSELALNMLAVAAVIGFCTRTVGLLACASGALTMLSMRNILPMPLIGQNLDAAVLAMVGPGALSIDACLFGRRTLHLPK